MPFISDYLYHKLSGTSLEENKSVMVMNFPKNINKENKNIENKFDFIKEIIISIRRAKTLIGMGNSNISKAYVKINNKLLQLDKNEFEKMAKLFIQGLGKVEDVEFVNQNIKNSITEISENFEIFISKNNIDTNIILKKLSKQKEKVEKNIEKLNGMLLNKKFIEKAPESLINKNLIDLEELKNQLQKIEDEILKFK